MKETLLSWVRQAVWGVPNARILNYISYQYQLKYNNSDNTDFDKNGERRWLAHCLNAKTQPVIFDVGANIGDWTEQALKLCPSARIYAFEPYPPTFDRLSDRFKDNAQVTVIPSGMGDQAGEMEMKIFADADAHNSLHGRSERKPDFFHAVSIATLDGFCTAHDISHIHFLKVDTEGHDYAVLRGARDLLREGRIDFVQFEYSNNYIEARVFLKDIFDFVADMPYSIYRIMPKHLKVLDNYHYSFENFQYSNFALVRNDIDPGKGLS